MSAQKILFGTVRMGLKCLQHGEMHTTFFLYVYIYIHIYFAVCCYFSFQIPLEHFFTKSIYSKEFFPFIIISLSLSPSLCIFVSHSSENEAQTLMEFSFDHRSLKSILPDRFMLTFTIKINFF